MIGRSCVEMEEGKCGCALLHDERGFVVHTFR